MSVIQYWQEQRTMLQSSLTEQTAAQDAITQVRRSLLQTEQNALASMSDDILRQQTAVLLNCIKGSLHLLEAHSAGHVWVAQKHQSGKTASSPLWLCSAAALGLLLVWCWWESFWIAAALVLSVGVIGFFALLQERKNTSASLSNDEMRITVGVHPERLLNVLDSQIKAIDRYIDDFAYLNEQARGGADQTDPILLSRASELMEALCECDETERAAADEAACRLLQRLGMQAVSYTKESSRLFNTLPSKSTTRTLTPAIVSANDQRLLRRGTAAVQMDLM